MLFTIEGCDGCGKTSVLNVLKTYVNWEPYKVIFTREPGGQPVSEDIRRLLEYYNDSIEIETEALLFLAARYEHYYKKILPNLLKGNIIFCDRFIDSTYAYQVARGGNIDKLKTLHDLFFPNLKISKTYFLDVPPVICAKRVLARDPSEEYDLHLQEKIYAQYKINFRNKKDILEIDAVKNTPKEIANIILKDMIDSGFIK